MAARERWPPEDPPGPYAGIGSRATPADVLALMRQVGEALARRGWTLRTGLSPGADQAFFAGALAAGGEVELYLPWLEFEAGARQGAGQGRVHVLSSPSGTALELAASLHPRWDELSETEWLLLARDGHEILGANLARPASFAVCWTAEGSLEGEGVYEDGTGQALRVAAREGVPVWNLAREEDRAAVSAGVRRGDPRRPRHREAGTPGCP